VRLAIHATHARVGAAIQRRTWRDHRRSGARELTEGEIGDGDPRHGAERVRSLIVYDLGVVQAVPSSMDEVANLRADIERYRKLLPLIPDRAAVQTIELMIVEKEKRLLAITTPSKR
jgi:hypothetical protein